MTYLAAAIAVLKTTGRPMTVREITAAALKKGLIKPRGRTPEATMSAALYRYVRDTDQLDSSRIQGRHDPSCTRFRPVVLRRVTVQASPVATSTPDATWQRSCPIEPPASAPLAASSRQRLDYPLDLITAFRQQLTHPLVDLAQHSFRLKRLPAAAP